MAITRKEALLKSISGGESANVSPITREEQYLSYIAGESNSYPSQPITREEVYLDKIAKSGISGGGSGVNVQSLSVTENGTYTAPSGVAYSPIFVDVETEEIPTQEKTVDITENGTTEITADEGYLLSKVTANVNVASSGGSVNKFQQFVSRTITEVTAEDMEGATIGYVLSSMFHKCVYLKKCYLPDTITSIGSHSFNGCSSLVSMTLPNTVTSIGSNAFENCTALASITIPSLVTTIASVTFSRCASLKTVVIEGNVTNMGAQAFMYCNLERFVIKAETPPSIQANTFLGVPTTCRFEVPAESVEAYKAATNWSKYADQIFAIEE